MRTITQDFVPLAEGAKLAGMTPQALRYRIAHNLPLRRKRDGTRWLVNRFDCEALSGIEGQPVPGAKDLHPQP